MSDALHDLSASEAARRIAEGQITAEALVRSCLERIEEREASIAAWEHLDRRHAIAQARQLDRSGVSGRLHGVPVAFKDIIDTADLPTGYGSPIYRGHRPTSDATCVTLARAAGAVVMGKTVTTEFAYRYPGKTANPHNRNHTPGGSSSGSAAAVADRMVPLAVGTQTAGSVIRPAAYCGVYGMKPTYGTLSLGGVRHLAESFDTLGIMARTLDDLSLFRSVLLGTKHRPAEAEADGLPPPRIAFCRTPFWDQADPGMRALFEEAVGQLRRAGARMTDLTLRPSGPEILEASTIVTKFEAARLVAYERRKFPDDVSSAVRLLADEGGGIEYRSYVEAQRVVEGFRAAVHADIEGIDMVLTPSASGEAPLGLGDTGPVLFQLLWTIAHMPALTIPALSGPNGLPIGVQLVGARHDDDRLLQLAQWVDARLNPPSDAARS